jgi:hypothetical protein
MWQRLPGRPDAEHETLQRLELENGSRVISLPGNEKTVRGLASVDLIVIDEAARVDDELLAATRPMGRGARTRFRSAEALDPTSPRPRPVRRSRLGSDQDRKISGAVWRGGGGLPHGASLLFAVALVRADEPLRLTAVLPGVPAVLAPIHPAGLGDGERAVS